jgi:hypothetical protein
MSEGSFIPLGNKNDASLKRHSCEDQVGWRCGDSNPRTANNKANHPQTHATAFWSSNSILSNRKRQFWRSSSVSKTVVYQTANLSVKTLPLWNGLFVGWEVFFSQRRLITFLDRSASLDLLEPWPYGRGYFAWA